MKHRATVEAPRALRIVLAEDLRPALVAAEDRPASRSARAVFGSASISAFATLLSTEGGNPLPALSALETACIAAGHIFP